MENNRTFIAVDTWDSRQHKKNFIEALVAGKFDDAYVFTQNEWEYNIIFDELLPPLLGYFLEHSGRQIDVIASVAEENPNIPKYKGYNLHLWDTYWLYKTYGMLKMGHIINERKEQKERTNQLKYHYIMMNNRTHDFRCSLIDKITKMRILDKGAVSWNNRDTFLMNGYKFQYFDGENRVLDEKYNTSGGGQYSLPDQYFQSFAQLISESTPTKLFFSEKVSIPLIVGKPFIAAAGVGLHSYLRDRLGFKLYDEVFDYSFDAEPDMSRRWDMIVENFKNLTNLSMEQLKELEVKIKDKIIYNQYRAREIVHDVNFIPKPVQDCFYRYEKQKITVSDKLIHCLQNINDSDALDSSWDLI